MAARGTEAKAKVIEKIKEAFGQDYIGEYDKKIYLVSSENGEKVQVAISLTCPKVPVATSDAVIDYSRGRDFESMGTAIVAPEVETKAEVTDEELATVQELMARLGL